MSLVNPCSTIQSDASTGALTAQLSTGGAAHVVIVSGSSSSARAQSIASMGISANVNAQVAPQVGLTLMGIAARANAVTVGAIVRGATATGGAVMIPFRLANNATSSVWLGPDGIASDAGISVLVTSGNLDLVTFYRVQP